jgi:hypothetical protein
MLENNNNSNSNNSSVASAAVGAGAEQRVAISLQKGQISWLKLSKLLTALE